MGIAMLLVHGRAGIGAIQLRAMSQPVCLHAFFAHSVSTTLVQQQIDHQAPCIPRGFACTAVLQQKQASWQHSSSGQAMQQ